MTPGLQEKLPPTDSRLRRDLHLLERAVYNEVSQDAVSRSAAEILICVLCMKRRGILLPGMATKCAPAQRCRLLLGQANNAKLELEELDRAYCAALKAARPDKAPIAPHFFELVAPQTPAGKGLRWRYRQGSYWEAREQADWATLPHIFGGVQ